MNHYIDINTKITTDKWTESQPLQKDFKNVTQVYSGDKGGNFPELHRVIMNLKSWLRRVHHHVRGLQDDLDEDSYRFSSSFIKETIFDHLLNRMVVINPCLIKNISD